MVGPVETVTDQPPPGPTGSGVEPCDLCWSVWWRGHDSDSVQTRFTSRAVAYLKAALPNDGSPLVEVTKEDSPIARLYADGLCVCYVVDVGESYQYVQRRHLSEDGLTSEQLHRVALDNLADLANQRQLRVQPHGNVFAVLMGGDFEASMMLLDPLWDQNFRQFVKGDYAVVIPNRDILAFCDSTSENGVKELREVVRRVHTSSDHPISDKVFVRRQKTWQPLGESHRAEVGIKKPWWRFW